MGDGILTDTPNELVLGASRAHRWTLRLTAVAILLMMLPIIIDYPSGLLYFGPMAALIWIIADHRVTIRFNKPPGHLTVTYDPIRLFGGLTFIRRTKSVPLDDATRVYGDMDKSFFASVGPSQGGRAPVTGGTQTVYTVRMPLGNGESILVYSGSDPEAARHVEQRLRTAAATPVEPRGTDASSRRSTTQWHQSQ